MGNRAFITDRNKQLGIYVHWNGGRDSVEAFLKYCDLKGYRCPESDGYGWARLAQVIANYFGGTNSVGIYAYTTDDEMDPGDNGIYVIERWAIVDRIGCRGEQMTYDQVEMLCDIDARQPADEQLGEGFLRADEVTIEQIAPGDEVYVPKWDGGYEKLRVAGLGRDRWVNGRMMSNVPYVGRYTDVKGRADASNPNNYLTDPTYRRAS